EGQRIDRKELCPPRTVGARAVWSPRESSKRSATTCPRECVCQGARAPGAARVEDERGDAEGPQAETQRARCPGAEPRGRPLAGEPGSAQGRRRRPGFPGLPLARARAQGAAGPGSGGGAGRGGPGSPPGSLSLGAGAAGLGASGAVGAASPNPRALGGRFGLSPPRRPPAPLGARLPPPPAAWSAPPSPPRVWRAGTGQAAGAAESTSRRRGSRSGHTMRELAIEIGVRALLFGVFVFTEFLDPFQRVIQPEEIWLYKNPLVQSDNIPTRLMFAISFLTPLAVICVVKIIRRTDKTEIKEAFLAVSLALALNGVCTNTIKLIVGR
uniref:Phospholipid phosphatase 4 n=1 Tax=Bos mutus grunniens TaxID=30521 RepID=A0A8C0AJH8_BOSMU